MLKIRISITGTNPQGVAVNKHERTFTADLKCTERAEKDVLEMVAKHLEEMAANLEQAASDAQMVASVKGRIALGAVSA